MVKDVTPKPLSDEQQSMQALRQYGGYIIMAIVLALAGYFGWNYYQNHGGRIDTAAANDFAKLQADQMSINNLSQNPTPDDKTQKLLNDAKANFNKDLDSFISQHDNSIYTWQALMLKSKQQMQANDAKGAITTLQKATTLKFGDAGLEAIATLRYAQALLINNQADDAQKALQTAMPPAFDASKEELLGDISMAKNDKNGAIAHYQKAWQVIETRNQKEKTQQDRAMLRLKMQDLGLNPKLPEENNIISQPPKTSQAAASVASATAPKSADTTDSDKKSDKKIDKKTDAPSKNSDKSQ